MCKPSDYLKIVDDDNMWTAEWEVQHEIEVDDTEKKVERCLEFILCIIISP